jgi:hypothetical protein
VGVFVRRRDRGFVIDDAELVGWGGGVGGEGYAIWVEGGMGKGDPV